ncbi:MAG TPA: hypothetical protein VEQ59_21670 [Polyangiaceae bacterium]|nr:hypothetical protein [Polyangiaceae bacterium]
MTALSSWRLLLGCAALLACGRVVDLGGSASLVTESIGGIGNGSSMPASSGTATDAGLSSGGGGTTGVSAVGQESAGDNGSLSANVGSGGAADAPPQLDPSEPLGSTCPSACADEPPETLSQLETEQEIFTAILGRWEICNRSPYTFPQSPEDVIGVEYTAPELRDDIFGGPPFLEGDMYYLIAGDKGPERGVGDEYSSTYEVRGSPGNLHITMNPEPNATFGGDSLYSSCPHQWRLWSMYKEDWTMLVPFE